MRASFNCSVLQLIHADGVKQEMATQTEATLALTEDCIIDVVTDNEVELVIPTSQYRLVLLFADHRCPTKSHQEQHLQEGQTMEV
jgi:hypothetical protein